MLYNYQHYSELYANGETFDMTFGIDGQGTVCEGDLIIVGGHTAGGNLVSAYIAELLIVVRISQFAGQILNTLAADKTGSGHTTCSRNITIGNAVVIRSDCQLGLGNAPVSSCRSLKVAIAGNCQGIVASLLIKKNGSL